MIVVSDASPLHYLILIDAEWVLPKLYQIVIIPEAVYKELQDEDTPVKVRDWLQQAPYWLEVRAASKVYSHKILDPGESEAIGLALEMEAYQLLLDETNARKVAQKLGLKVIGTLGVLGFATREGLLDFREAIEKLKQTNFYYSEELINSLLKQYEKP